ncbi:MAG: Ig-like domain-containing protein, partial [Fuerstiella sp.]
MRSILTDVFGRFKRQLRDVRKNARRRLERAHCFRPWLESLEARRLLTADPTLDALSNLTIDEDAAEQTVSLAGISAGGGESQPLRVTTTSSKTSLIPHPAVTYTSAESTGSIAFTPVADESGPATITVTVEDGGLDGDLDTGGDNKTFSRDFVITVNAVNDNPTLNALSDLTIDEDAAEQTVNLSGITAGGGESQPLNVTATSSSTGLIPNLTIRYLTHWMYWSETDGIYRAHTDGSGEELLSTPGDGEDYWKFDVDPDEAKIYIAVGTGHNSLIVRRMNLDGSQLEDVSTSDALGGLPYGIALDLANDVIYVQPHHLPPVYPGAPPGGLQRLDMEGTNLQTLAPKPYYSHDMEVDSANSKLYYTDDVSYEGIRRVNLDGSNVENVVNITGYYSVAKHLALDVDAGVVYFTVDIDTGNEDGKIWRADLDGGNQQVIADVNAFDIEIDQAGGKLYWTSKTHIQRANLDGSGIEDLVELSGSGRQKSGSLYVDSTRPSPSPTAILHFTPLSDQSGTATITVTVEDGGLDGDLDTGGDNATFSRDFVITVNAVNDAPTLNALSDLTILEDAAQQTVSLAGISAGGGESQPLRVTTTSSKTSLIPHPAVTYASAEATGTLRFTPVADESGTATITVTVEDGGLDGDLDTGGDNGTF